ncbi:MAG: hypothetical protein RSA22_00760 [Acinetobacter sp.]
MKPWQHIFIGIFIGAIITGVSMHLYYKQIFNFINEMQYVSTASHIVAYDGILKAINQGDTNQAQQRVELLIQSNKQLMTDYEAQMLEENKELPKSKVVTDAKNVLSQYPTTKPVTP